MSVRAVDPARSRVVLVGTATYATADPLLPDVPVVANNIADLAAVLTDPHLGGFAPEHCLIAPPGANQGEIGELLEQAAEEAEDLLLFYYSGHGMLGPRNGELYLTLSNTRSSSLAYTALPFEAIRNTLLESKATNRVVILDSCFSGRAIGETLADGDEPVLGQLQVAGTYTLTSSPANRTAQILPGEVHTAFTERMLDLLRGGSADSGEVISLGDIYRYLFARLNADGLPTPQQRGTQTADLLGLVRNALAVRKVGGRVTSFGSLPGTTVEAADGGWDVFDVVLVKAGDSPLKVVKALREVLPLSLQQAKDLADGTPERVLRRVAQETAFKANALLELAGATVTLRAERVVPSLRGARARIGDDVGWDMFNVILDAVGPKPDLVVAAIRTLTGLGVGDAQDLVNRLPVRVFEKIDKQTAYKVKAYLEKAGAKVVLRPTYVVPQLSGERVGAE